MCSALAYFADHFYQIFFLVSAAVCLLCAVGALIVARLEQAGPPQASFL